MRGITKVFAGTLALRQASLSVDSGEIHGLLGENGAGKSTMIKILAGVHQTDAGEVLIDGVSLPHGHTPAAAAAAGVAFLHQDFGLVGDMSVAENIGLAIGFARKGPVIDWHETRKRARDALRPLGADILPDRLVSELPIGSRALVAIARAAASRAKVLVLDEPTASLTAAEVAALFRVLRRLRDSGVACVFVSHRLDEVHAICDRVTVLRDGVTVGTVNIADVSRRDVVRMIVGHDVAAMHHVESSNTQAERLTAIDLRGAVLGPVSFQARVGEILGVTGLSDSGCSEIGDLLFGRTQRTGGKLSLDGRPFRPRNPARAMSQGVAFVPADRAADGLVQTMTLRENLNLNPTTQVARKRPGKAGAVRNDVGPWRIIRGRSERRTATAMLRLYDVRPPEPERETSTLSGGNAQKLMLAKWLALEPPLLVLNEPTAGVDVGAREEIYDFLRAAARRGCTCLVISSDFEEVAQLCDRALIFYRGRISRELAGSALTASNVVSAALDPGWSA